MAIRKIKLPNEQEPREIGALSSNVIYDAVTPTVSLNQKISSMDQIIEGLNSFEIAVVNSLPTQDIDDHTIYFVPQSQGSTTHDEYMYINNQWELIGTTTIDLSDYVTYDDISITQGLTTGIEIGSIDVNGITTSLYAPKTYEVEVIAGDLIEEESSFNNDVYEGSFANSNDSLTSIIQKINDGYNVVALYDGQILPLEMINLESEQIGFTVAVPGGIITAVAIYTEDSEEVIRIYCSVSPTSADVWYEPYTGHTPGIAGTIYYNNESADITYQNNKVFQQAETRDSFSNNNYILYSKNSNSETNQVYKRSNVKILSDSSIKIIDGNDNTCIYGPTEIRFYHDNMNKTLSISPDFRITGTDSNAHIINKYNYEVIPIGSSINVGSTTTPVYLSDGELLACTLPSPASYSLSMTGATITLLADNVAASTITLPIYDGTIQ